MEFNEFSALKAAAAAQTRALKATYTIELAEDLKAIHGLDAETELANILAAEIKREVEEMRNGDDWPEGI